MLLFQKLAIVTILLNFTKKVCNLTVLEQKAAVLGIRKFRELQMKGSIFDEYVYKLSHQYIQL
jgi:hypothetical protein